MKLMALDTAMAACSVAVYDGELNLVLSKSLMSMERGHAEAVAPMVRDVMAEAGLGFTALDRIMVTVGPGTFTGVRVGLAMARGLGLALDIPVAGIDTLSAIAANETREDLPLLVAADARKDEVYTVLFDVTAKHPRAPAVTSIGACLRMLPQGPVVVLGSGADAVIAASGRSDLRRSRAGDLPIAANFVRLGIGAPTPEAMPVPLYLRSPDAMPREIIQRKPLAVTIRDIEVADAGILAALHGECFDNPWATADFTKLMAMPGASASLALEIDEPVGFSLIRRAAGEAEIITIGTRPFAQRRGVAKALIEAQSKFLAAQGIALLFIEVAASNSAARALYESAGFAAAGNRRNYYERDGGRREDAIVMRKELAK
jgi:tRNA threonylcarbamoyl adenosine modification protein YeaZ/ribosomal-protein-alanine acetyltransferase